MLLERDDQLLELGRLRDDLDTAHGHLVFVGGDAGVGKSTLVAAFTDSVRAGERRLPVHQGACDDLTTPAPLGPVIDALPEVEELAEQGLERHRLFRRVRQRLAETATLLVLEDVHWADEATLDLLRFLGRRLEGLPLLVVTTYRTEETSPDHPLTTLLGDLGSAAGVRRMIVPPLSPRAVEELVTASGSALDPEQLHERTGGNAFYVTEVLAKPGDEVPVTVRDAVLARASRLTDDAAAVLAAAAVIGQPAQLGLLVDVSGRSATAVDECVAKGLLTGDGTRWDFRHALARSAIADTLAPGRAAELHATALRALRPIGDDRRLAYHADRSGNREAAGEHAERAATRAARLGAHREAAELYRMALEAHPARDGARAELWSALAYECYLTGRLEDARDARREALELAETPLATGEALRWLSRLSWFLGHNEDSEVYAARAIETLEPGGASPSLAMAYSNQAQLRMLATDIDEAIAWGDRALTMARQLGDRQIEAHALNNLGTSQALAGDYHGGMTRLRQSLDLSLAEDAHEHAARAFTNLGSMATIARRFDEADRHLISGIAYSRERDLDSWEFYMAAWFARSLAEQGRYAEADDVLTPMLGRPRLPTVVRIPMLSVAGQLAARRDRHHLAAQLLDEAALLAQGTHETQRLAPVAVARAEASWLAGQLDAIPDQVDDAWQATVTRGQAWDIGELAWWRSLGGEPPESMTALAEPFRLMLEHAWEGAASTWEALGCPFWIAVCLARLPDLDSARRALRMADDLDAPALHRAIVRDRQQLGLPVPRGPRPSSTSNAAGLTTRELEVLALLADGLSNAGIADALVLSTKTVGHHVSSILTKLGEPSRSRAVATALRLGLVTPAEPDTPQPTH